MMHCGIMAMKRLKQIAGTTDPRIGKRKGNT
jgi:hypothetical protein